MEITMSERSMSSQGRTRAGPAGRAHGTAALIAAGLERLLLWQQRARERRELGSLSDDLLKDMGLSRSTASEEARKPFWRG
jgi:uncharacterized protein YjiS (DUF1127 family)